MLGSGEIIIILCVVMLLFGGKKLPEFARSLGKGIREFKKACNEVDADLNSSSGAEDPKDRSPTPSVQSHEDR